MVRPLALCAALALAARLAAQQPQSLTVRFPLASAEMLPADHEALLRLCAQPHAARVARIALHGHTDERGSLAYNEELSRRRAEAVRAALDGTCLRGRPVELAWSGERMPLTRAADEPAHAANRRVEVLLHYEESAAQRIDPCAHPKVKPLLPGIDKPRERHPVDASAPIDVVMGDGVRVLIPAASIVDARGNPVEGMVELSYRSFSEPFEIIAAGIPMHVATAAGTGHFETAGMYELYARREGEPLALAPGARITLERPGGQPLAEGFVGWALDPATGAWAQRGTVQSVPVSASAASPATEATALYWRKLRELENEKRPDTTRFDDRRNSGRYCHLTACDTTSPGGSWLRRRDRFKRYPKAPEIRVAGYKGMYDPDRVVFVIQIGSEHDKQFPDWRRLPHKAIWQYEGPDSRTAFKRLYGRRHLFQDIHLDMKPGAESGILWLKENGEWLPLPVSAKWNRATPLKAARWDRAVNLYAQALDRRRARFDREVARRGNRYQREHADMPRAAWKHAQRAMNEQEKAMELDAWRDYAATRRPMDWGTAQAAFASVRTSFGLEGFGLYNIDRILKMPEQQQVLASAELPDGRPFPWVNAFAVLKDENSVVTYWGSGRGTGDHLLVAPGRMEALILVDADGNVARADAAPLNSREPRVALKARLLAEPKSIDELRADAGR